MRPCLILPALAAASLATAQTTLNIDISKPGHKVSPMLYGLMTEEINHSYDGGLYGELIQNRAFKDAPRETPHWTALGDATIVLDREKPLSEAANMSLRLTGSGAAANDGYWGIPVRPSTTYRASFFARGDAARPLTVRIESKDGKTVYASGRVEAIGTSWAKHSLTLTTTAGIAPTTDARFVIATGGGTTWLSLVSLFPPTFKDRPNGNRSDLMQKLVDMKPAFLRFPGGNYLEGDTFKDRFDWKRTLGPLENRPGHMAPWSYRSSDGLGLMEFLQWTEDMGAKPLLGVFAGYVLRRDVIESGTALKGFVDDALDEIEYLVGGPRTKWGAQRVKDGHPKPFPLEYVEVGNEDGFDLSGSYEGRFAQFYDAIKAKHPKIKVIATTGGQDSLGIRFPIRSRKPDLVDEHYYASSWDMMAMAGKYDAYPRTGPKIFVGEWASQDVPQPWVDPGAKGPTPTMGSALGDAAFMTGMERNADLIEMSCYAPLLVNVNPGARQWAVNLIGYDGLTSFGSPSYYAQVMFKQYLGDVTVPSVATGVPTQTRAAQTIPALFHSVTRDSKTGTIYVKVVNPLATAQEVTLSLDGATIRPQGTAIVLAAPGPGDANTLAQPTKVAPTSTLIEGLGTRFTRTLAPYSITILKLETK